MNPTIASVRRAAARAAWLGKLSDALEIADNLTIKLSRDTEHIEALVELAAQIALLRSRIDALRCGEFDPGHEVGPEWTISSPSI